MSTPLTNTNKTTLTITNTSKDTGITWNQSVETWDAAEGTWDVAGLIIAKDTKITITITPTTKL